MKELVSDLSKGIWALPPFPVVLVTVDGNIMTAGAFHFYSFNPPSVMVGIIPEKYTYELINRKKEFGINIPKAEQIELVRTCGSVSGRDVDDKYSTAGVTPFQGNKIKSYLIEECPVNLECVVVHQVGFRGTHQWFVGEIQAVHIDDTYTREQPLMFWSGEYRKVGEFLEKAW
ncbi:MAG: flavin reductase family protein [Candidatus Aminicenantes bacterium]|jgi:flavin reductase (DIM6/NTAB) family NADH-FMN oxidoreductase RutF